MSETDFIRREQFLAALREKGLLVDRKQSSDAVGVVGQIVSTVIGATPTAVTLQVDNGFMVIFSPSKMSANVERRVIEGHVAMPYGGSPTPMPSLEQQQAMMQAEAERRRKIAAHGLRTKLRVRVYPALSQAMDEIRKFYEAGGIVPGIDFDKLAEETVDEIGVGTEEF